MSTSLAAQLQARKTVDQGRLQSAKTLKNPPSFIYTPRHASSVTNADLHALAANAWDQLAAIDPFFGAHFKEILGEQAKTLDRTGLTKEENDRVGKTVDRVLRALGKHMLLKPAGIVLEWLIRRFRVQDFNVGNLIALFLPYHATAHFPSALNVIPDTNLAETPFSALLPAKKTLAPLPLVGLIDLFPPFSRATSGRPLLDFVLHLPLDYLKNGETPHRALTAFWLQAIAAYLDRAGTRLPDGERAAVLSTILEVLRSARSAPDALIASYILVARFALHNPFDAETLRVVLKGVVTNRARSHVADEETDAALVTTLVIISQLGEEDLEVGGGKKFLGNSGWKSLLKTPKLDELVVQLSNQYDAERFLKPFLKTLAEDALTSEESLALLSSILIPRPSSETDAMMTLPSAIMPVVLSSCFTAILSNPTASPSALQRPLSQMYQRYPAVWTAQSSVFTARAKSSADESAVSRLLKAMNGVLGGSSDSSSALVLSASAPDVALRVQALRDILKNAEEVEAEGNASFIRDTLIARLAEPEAVVAEVLFAEGTRLILHRIVGAEDILTALEPALQNQREKYLAQVLAYLAGPYAEEFPEQATTVVRQVFWPRLLATKADARLHCIAAAALKGSHLERTQSWLKGLSVVLVTEQQKVSAEVGDRIVEVIAKNMAASTAEDLDATTAFLLDRLGEEDKLAIVVALRLASKMEKARRVPFAQGVLRALHVARRGLDAVTADEAVELVSVQNSGALSPALQQALFAHSGDEKVLRNLLGALVVGSFKSVHPNPEASWSWLAPTTALATVHEFTILCREVYDVAHSHHGSKGAVSISNMLLETLFSSLVTDDALAFLAATFTNVMVPVHLRLAALRNTAAFLEIMAAATAKPKGKLVDWQVVIPSLVVALSDVSDDQRVRAEALRTLEAARNSLKTGPTVKIGTVYGRDKFYGAQTTSAHLKYLELADIVAYLDMLLESKAELILSPTHLKTLHASLLDSDSTESPKKRKPALSAKVATYLVSHVAAWKTSLGSRVKLLAALEGVKDREKSIALVALVAEAIEVGPSESKREVDAETEYARLLLAPYNGATRKWLEGEETRAVEILVSAVEVQDLAGLRAALRKEALRHIAKTVFTAVRADTRLELFKRLVHLAITSEARVSGDVVECLRQVQTDSETLSAFLGDFKSSLAPPAVKGAKRGRVSVGGSASSTSRTERLPELAAVFESIDITSISPTPSLLLNLFEILAALVDLPTSGGQTDVSYPGQLVLTALARLVEQVKPESGITGDSIRMTPVLDFMRSSVNPQTYHQALLLLAQLGPLVPDQLVHNVMPIFTFMGANVLQRDDAYSLRVVDQTLDSIVPALVKAMQKSARGRDKLLRELNDLLRAFTDAASHVPRHRRINLFVRLVETLGPKDFLSAVVMLLVDKAGKATYEAVALPLALAEHFSVDIQLGAYRQMVEEIGRLLNLEESFLTDSSIAAAPVGSATAKEQAMTLLAALGFALEAKQLLSKVDSGRAAGSETVDTSVSELVRGLLDLASTIHPSFEEAERTDLTDAAENDVRAAVALLSTKAFAEALLWLLEMADPAIQPRVFALLCARLPHVKPTRRADLTPAVNAVVSSVLARLEENEEDVDASLDTLDAVADAAVAEEDPALAKTVLTLVALAGDAERAIHPRAKALSVLKKLTHRLGPRLIPLVGKLVPFSLELLRKQAGAGVTAAAALVAGAYETLEGLFVSVPAFIGGQLDKIFSAALSTDIMALSSSSGQAVVKARATLLSTAAKKLPAKTLFPAIIRLHASLGSTERAPLLGFLDLLNRALRHGKTADIAEQYRSIFKLFLTVFDLRREHDAALEEDDVVAVEDHALGAFVQFILKLNEQLFRPLFLRTYDWAVIDLADEEGDAAASGLVARRTVLYRVVDRLLGQLRSIFVPYFAFMLDQTVEVLDQAAKGEMRDAALWSAVAGALTKAFEYDENGFWSPARLAKLATPIAQQLEVRPAVAPTETYHAFVTAYVSLLGAHESHLKTFNSRLLHLTRSDDLRVKRAAVDTLDVVWEEVGDGMLGLVPETTPFLAETREETEGGVEAATRRLVKRIEEHLGESLDEYLEQ